MNKINLKTAIEKYDGWIIKHSNGYEAQNSNDLGLYFGEKDDLKYSVFKVITVFKVPSKVEPEREFKILLLDDVETLGYEDEENFFKVLCDAIDYIIDCWE